MLLKIFFKKKISVQNVFYFLKSIDKGLDPAGLYYSIEYDGPPRGLNQTCCQYVQAIHTDMAIGSRQGKLTKPYHLIFEKIIFLQHF